MATTENRRGHGRPPAFTAEQRRQLVAQYESGEYTYRDLQALHKVGLSTLYRAIHGTNASTLTEEKGHEQG
ncbi:hypothetical protein [Gulosibacter sp. 10]|uniref:hypothetical protein n=1 Tax=Gulosibacter sp. 10 TaxID=1255570 RepID=UPI00097EF204|nr:hypothetical protein [Gulosibacter sp. 10]SJM69655.1 hypothetical protein FM112_14365 [Gulosibacter sp. 10]